MICFCYNFLTELKKQTLTCFIFVVLLSKNVTVYNKCSTSVKNIIIEEELVCIDIDDIKNLEDSPGLEFIDEGCENLIVANE